MLIHPTPSENFKVTTPLDLRLAELLLAERTGSVPEQDPDQRRREAELADPRATPKLAAPSRAAMAVPAAKASSRTRSAGASHRPPA